VAKKINGNYQTLHFNPEKKRNGHMTESWEIHSFAQGRKDVHSNEVIA
jgi:hypothetical protein